MKTLLLVLALFSTGAYAAQVCPDGSWANQCNLCPDGHWHDSCDLSPGGGYGGSQLCPDGTWHSSCGLCPNGQYGCFVESDVQAD